MRTFRSDLMWDVMSHHLPTTKFEPRLNDHRPPSVASTSQARADRGALSALRPRFQRLGERKTSLRNIPRNIMRRRGNHRSARPLRPLRRASASLLLCALGSGAFAPVTLLTPARNAHRKVAVNIAETATDAAASEIDAAGTVPGGGVVAAPVSPPSDDAKNDGKGRGGEGERGEDGSVEGIGIPDVVLVAGFESFNRDLYLRAAERLPEGTRVNLRVFADSEIRRPVRPTEAGGRDGDESINPDFAAAMRGADAFVGSLIFDYDDALAVKELLPHVKGPRLVFESATELMTYNRVGTFSMEQKEGQDGPSGPPPAVKAILNKFSSGKEEDKISGYLKMLKVGPDLLKYVPGEKAGDLRTWLEAYRYWNQGGIGNAAAMLQLLSQRCLPRGAGGTGTDVALPDLEVTPDVGLLHPLLMRRPGPARYFISPNEYVRWRESDECSALAAEARFTLAPPDAPRVAVLLYRKHVITGLKYIDDLLTMMEDQGLFPIPIFINGVEAHTIVRDLLTSRHEIDGVDRGAIKRDGTYQPYGATRVDAIVSTIGFPLVGGPAGSMEAGRNVAVAKTLLGNMNVPYVIAAPLLLQSIQQWKRNGVLGLQSVVLYSLPELDGAVDTTVLGGLVGDKIALVPERVRKLAGRLHGWVDLRRTPPAERKVAVMLYGFPPNVGAVGTAALLDVPRSLENVLRRLHEEGYDVGDFATDPDANGESLVAALGILCENPVVNGGASRMQGAVEARMERARGGDATTAECLALPSGGMGGSRVRAFDVSNEDLERSLGKYMSKKVRRAWSERDRGPGVSGTGDLVVSGLQLGNVWVTVQPLVGVEGDPMRLLFERDLTPHPQYCAAYHWMRRPEAEGGVGAQAVIHLGMHGTVEWLPGQPLGNDRQSWSDDLLGSLPNLYVYAANNPSESILAKRRGYGTLISYNVPPYGRAGLYLELANLRDLIGEYRTGEVMDGGSSDGSGGRRDLRDAIWSSCQRCEIMNDVPLLSLGGETSSAITDTDLPSSVTDEMFDNWVAQVADYLVELQDRLFSSGLHTLGSLPTDEELISYLNAYFGDKLSDTDFANVITSWHEQQATQDQPMLNFIAQIKNFASEFMGDFGGVSSSDADILVEGYDSDHDALLKEAQHIVSLLSRNTEELDSIVNALDGGYVPPKPGGDLLRDGTSVLPTGRNIHALDPYRMPSAGAWARGQRAAREIIRQHREKNGGAYPQTCAVTLWGLDTIKTRGKSLHIIFSFLRSMDSPQTTWRILKTVVSLFMK